VTRRSWLLLLALVAVAALCKSSYLVAFERLEPLADAPYGDSVVYLDEARRHFREGAADAFYKPPAYSFILHAFDADTLEGAQRVRWLQLVMGLASLWLVFVLARRRGGDLAGCAAFVLLLSYAPSSFFETKLLDATTGSFLLLLTVAATDLSGFDGKGRAGAGLLAGVLFGLSGLTRTVNLLLVPLLAALLFRQRRFAFGASLLLGASMTVLPVTIANLRATGDVIPVNYSEGHTFHVGNNENARGIYALPPGYPDGVLNERLVEREMARAALGREPSPAQQRDLSYARGVRFLREHPERVPGLLLDKLRFALSSREVSDNYSIARERQRFGFLSWAITPFWLLLLLGVFGLFLLPSGPGRSPWVVAAPIGMTLAVLLVFYVTCRYRVMAAPFLAIVGGVGFTVPRATRRRLPIAIAGAVACGLLTFFLRGLPYSAADLRTSEQQFDVILDVHAARALEQSGRMERAAAAVARSVADHPGNRMFEEQFIGLFGRLRNTPDHGASAAAAARQAAPDAARVAALLTLVGHDAP